MTSGEMPNGDFPLLIRHLMPTANRSTVAGEIVDASGLRFTYPQFAERVARLAGALTACGVKQGETVAVLDWDTHRYLECFYAIPVMGCVLMTVNVRLSRDQVRYTIDNSGATTVITHPDFLPLLTAGVPELRLQKIIVVGDAGDFEPPPDVEMAEYYAITEAAAPDFAYPDVDERSRATMFYTSGTTGNPKGVYYSHRQIFLHTLGVLATFGTAPAQGRFGADDVYMPITPLFHAHAWGFPYAATLLGAKQVYPGRYKADILLRLIEEESVTFSHCVASVLRMLLDELKVRPVDLSRMKMLIGGGALPGGLVRSALEHRIDIFSGYGMSEAFAIQTVNHLTATEAVAELDEQLRLRTRPGRPALLCDVRTVTPDLGETAVGEEGEIVFRSPWLTPGYWRNEEESQELWRGGWLHSGDIGKFGEDGALCITDRVKDVIKSGGEWISSLLLESLISQVEGVAESAVIATPDARWAERPMALVVPREGYDLEVEAIRTALTAAATAGVIPRYGVPEHIKLVDALEKTSVGKLDKKALRARYVEQVV
ncbi:long-chain-fatty-acid--CoA ligase [Sphingomonas populi]|uniref:Long-chain-fatty-acid--CoA ligase n=1 Tax=Sphingomonas populi TaxID=2484750 RepID=A0A4Q6XV93_9SPHN|nr:long-chain-fatty-acid--CoA ligase [Sphingomonas populi]RZF60587.1 long-chain-fatty-acid--CoA ligase [Sphingomonas populi]